MVSSLPLALFLVSGSPNCVLRASTNSNQVVHVAVRLFCIHGVIHLEAAFCNTDLVQVILDDRFLFLLLRNITYIELKSFLILPVRHCKSGVFQP